MEEQQINLGHLRISQQDKGYLQHKICFKQCIKNLSIGTLDANQQQCVKNCIFRINATQRFMSQKIRQVMQNYIAGDPTIKAAYMAKGQKNT